MCHWHYSPSPWSWSSHRKGTSLDLSSEANPVMGKTKESQESKCHLYSANFGPVGNLVLAYWWLLLQVGGTGVSKWWTKMGLLTCWTPTSGATICCKGFTSLRGESREVKLKRLNSSYLENHSSATHHTLRCLSSTNTSNPDLKVSTL